MATRFPDSEFRAASHRPLAQVELERAQQFRVLFLEDARDALNFPIKITSFVRAIPGSVGTHGTGEALDIQPCRACSGGRISDATFQRRLQLLFEWIGINRPQSFGTLIHERNHVHVTLPGYQDRVGVVFREPSEGLYIPESLRPVFSLAPLLIGTLIFYFLLRQG